MPVLLVFAGMLTGVIRFATGMTPNLSLGLALIIIMSLILIIGWVFQQNTPTPLRYRLPYIAGGTALFIFSFFCLYSRYFDGVVALGSPDAGNHLQLSQIFLEIDPKTYAGFITCYSLAFALQKFGLDSFEAFAVIFYLIVGFICAAPFGFLALHTNYQVKKVSCYWFNTCLLLTLSLPLFYFALLPSLHYNHGEGFWVHLFGFLPLLALSGLYGTLANFYWRFSVMLIGIGFYRLTYGLNLGDLILTISVLLVLETGKAESKFKTRKSVGIVLLALVSAALFVYVKLFPLNDVVGAIKAPETDRILSAEVLMICSFFLYSRYFLPLVKPSDRRHEFTRVLRFISVFVTINLLVQLLYLLAELPKIYYFKKYNLHAIYLGSLLLPVLATDILRHFVFYLWNSRTKKTKEIFFTRPKLHVVLSGLALVLIFLSGAKLNRAHRKYQDSFQERVWGKPPWRTLDPLVDRKAERLIQNWLETEKKAFAGLIVWNYGTANFMNASFKNYDGITLLKKGRGLPSQGQCTFWLDNDGLLNKLANAKTTGEIQSYDSVMAWKTHDSTRCVNYSPAHAPEEEQKLCGLCL